MAGAGWLAGVLQAHQRGTQGPALSVAGRNGLGDGRTGGRSGLAINQLVPLRIERLGLSGGEGGQADPAGGIAAGILESTHLLDEVRLAGTERALVQGIDVVEHADEDLEPIVLGPARLLDFEPQGGLFALVGSLQEFREGLHLGGHALSDLLGGGRGLIGLFLDVVPAVGGAGDLRSDVFEVADLRDDAGQCAGFRQFCADAIFEKKRHDGEGSAARHAEENEGNLPGTIGSLLWE